ncbi:MAG: DotD/TraH family lipoprotein [Rhodanobacter sp.]|jgi:defect-in-organelle-trafficking protein DotD
MRVLKGGSLGLIGLLLAGCSTMASHPPPPTSGAEYISSLMASSVTQAVQAQQAFEQVLAENARTLSLKQKAIDTDQVDIDYIGKPQDILQSIAYRYGYGYVETGKRQDLRIVNVRLNKISPVEVLRSISYQISYGAKVILDKKTKELRLVYLNLSTPPPVAPARAASPPYGQPYSRPRSDRRG